MKHGSYRTWASTWSKQATEKFEVLRSDFVRRYGDASALFRTLSYEHGLYSSRCRLTFGRHCEFLEDYFPGSTVTWDAHPELSTWRNFSVTIASLEPGTWAWAHLHDPHDPSKNNRLSKHPDFRDIVRAGVDRGYHELVAHQLVPVSMNRWIEHKIAVEFDEVHHTFSGMYPSGQRRKRNGVRSVYALYSVQAERWCVVR